MRMQSISLFSLLLISCGRAKDLTETDYKLIGVGLNPDQISAAPKMYGSVVTYDYVEISGGALPLGIIGLSSFDAIGPGMSTFKPPYGVVSGSGYFFDSDMPVPNVLFGSLAVAPTNIGSCQTVFDPRSFVSGVSDVGSMVSLKTSEGAGMDIGRRPLYYPPDPSGVTPFYNDIAPYKGGERYWRDPSSLESLGSWESSVSGLSNFPFGQAVNVSYSGAIPDPSATFSSVPVPFSSSTAGASHMLPNKPSGVMVSWNGPLYSTDGFVLDEASVERSTCLQYQAHETAPENVADCIELAELPNPNGDYYPTGQMYTAPWDTADGKVTLQWVPQTINPDEVVSISVRFLGPVDESKRYFVEEKVAVPKTASAEAAWNQAKTAGLVGEDTQCPDVGYRAPLPCDEDVDFVFDPALRKGDSYISSLQGDPFSSLVEVTCRVDDAQGQFDITMNLLEDAIAYARQHNASGAVFYLNRTTTTEFDVPNVRDLVGNLREVGPLLVTSNAVQIGRFWFNKNAIDGE